MADILVLRRVVSAIDSVNRSYPKEAVEADVLTHSGMKSSTTMDLSLTATGTAGLLNDGFTTAVTVGGSALTTLDLGIGGAVTAINIGTNATPAKTITIGADLNDTVNINGNLNVSGTTTTVNATQLSINDALIFINTGNLAADAGIAVDRGGINDAVILWEEGNARWELGIADTSNGVIAPGAIATFSNLKVNDLLLAGTNVTADGALTVAATGLTADLTLTGRSNSITLNQVGNLALSGFTATSIIGALNEVKADVTASDSWAEVLTVGGGVSGGTSPTLSTGDSLIGQTALTMVSTTTGVVTIDSGTTGAINIGVDGLNAKTVTIGATAGAAATVLETGTGSLDLGINATAHEVNIGSATGVSGVTMNTGTGGINIGTNAVAAEVTIGNATGASGVTVNAGTGGIDIGVGTAVMTVNLGTGIGAKTVNVGSIDSTSATTIQSGTGVLTLDANGVLTINSEDDSTINVAGNLTILLDKIQIADGSAAGNNYSVTAGVGAATTGIAAAGIGGGLVFNAGVGGAGSISAAGGVGGGITLNAGAGGATGGAGAGADGTVSVGIANTSSVVLGATGVTVDVNGPLAMPTGQAVGSLDLLNVTGVSGTPTGAATDGSIAYDETNDIFYGRVNGAWTPFSTGAAETWAATLVSGNTSGANSPTISSGQSLIGAVELTMVSTTTGVVTIDSGTTGAINIGVDGLNAKTVTVGATAGASATVLETGTGSLDLGINATAHGVNIGSATGASGVTVNTGTGGINIGTNAVAATVTLGNVTGASAVVINSGTGGVTIDCAATANITLTAANSVTSDVFFAAHGSGNIPFNADGADSNLVGFTATSVIGALNELKATTSTGDLTNSYTAAVIIAAGSCVYISANDTVNLASANDFSAAAANFVGVAEVGQGTALNPVDVTCNGLATCLFEASITTPTVGDEIFLSATTPGRVTNVPPTGVADMQLSIGFLKNASTLTPITTGLNDTAVVQLVRGPKMAV